MKLITRETDYALRALCLIARQRDKGLVSVEDITRELKIPRPFLRRILRMLSADGILVSARGNKGGFHLARPEDKIRLIDVVTTFQGAFNMNQCLFKKRACPSRKTCVLRAKIEAIEDNVRRELESVTLAALSGGR